MLVKSTEMPNFKSEAEEADWYATPAGRRQTMRQFEKALKDGTLVRSTGHNIKRTDPKIIAELIAQAKQNATQAISIRVPIADLEQAKHLAAKTGVGYQTVLKRAIHEGLHKEVHLKKSKNDRAVVEDRAGLRIRPASSGKSVAKPETRPATRDRR